jgi:ribosomal protein L32E
MSIRMIARDLYRLQQEVERVEAEMKGAGSQRRQELEEELRKIKAERDKVRRMLEGVKEPPSCKKPR